MKEKREEGDGIYTTEGVAKTNKGAGVSVEWDN
jgi:hypothetical protein